MVLLLASRGTSTYIFLQVQVSLEQPHCCLSESGRRVNWRFSFGNADLNMKTGAMRRRRQRRRRRRRRRWQRCCSRRRFLSMLKMRSAASAAAESVVAAAAPLKRPIRFAYMYRRRWRRRRQSVRVGVTDLVLCQPSSVRSLDLGC